MNSNEQLDALARRSVQPDGSAATYATKSEIARCAAITAANFIEKGWWVEAYIELHAAARVCWERRDEERKQQNSVNSRNSQSKDKQP